MLVGVGEAKRKLQREYKGELPRGVLRAEPFCGGCLVLETVSFEEEKELAKRIAGCGLFDEWEMVVLHDSIEYARSTDKFLWATWTRFNPSTDVYAKSTPVKNNHISYEAPVVIDSRMKPWYPDEVEVRDDIARLVSSRWNEYFDD